MRTEDPRPIRLIDYTPPPFQIEHVRLEVSLDPDRTLVRTTSRVRRAGAAEADLFLHGEALELLSVAIDGAPVANADLRKDEHGLTVKTRADAFDLTIETAFSPRANTALSGIYLSSERIFSQCEAEGFRRITYFLDRPDVLATYEVRIEGDRGLYPTLLSNGNLLASGPLGETRHFAEWADPFPKPSYLFALVAGAFDVLEDAFTTMSGRRVPLRIYVDPGDAPKASYALDALKRSMRWDEVRFGREYDLDLFMIVAVRDFNFGAMENKGLNVFNSSLLLADASTATDYDFEAIESVVAHEYFHNWTGNRITCRDWFQLCLKEGLTVYRDQEFSADQRGAGEERIKSVRALRARQFPEDAGPLAHPVRPPSFVKIDNFYTATVYEKGAELIRMLATLLGEDAFARGMDLYFERCDGTAATMEDFLGCFADASGQDLDSFMTWYTQAGTPHLGLTTRRDASDGALILSARQETAPTAATRAPRPVPIPIRLGLLDGDGRPVAFRVAGSEAPAALEHTLVLSDAEASWRLLDAPADAALSPLRGFSAPVRMTVEEPAEHAARRAAHDPDLFNRWEAATQQIRASVIEMIGEPKAGVSEAALTTVARAIAAATSEPGVSALILAAPDPYELAQHVSVVDPSAIVEARARYLTFVADAFTDAIQAAHDALAPTGPFTPDAEGAGRRAARNALLRLRVAASDGGGAPLALARFEAADNMTDSIAALACLDASGAASFDQALAAFFGAWHEQPLVIDKWFALQARSPRADVLDRVRALLTHPDYDERTPNRARALLGGFAMGNLAGFHAADGAGYELFTTRVLAIDSRNPALAARLLGAFEIWPRLEPRRRAKARAALERVRGAKGASSNLQEIATRSLDASTSG